MARREEDDWRRRGFLFCETTMDERRLLVAPCGRKITAPSLPFGERKKGREGRERRERGELARVVKFFRSTQMDRFDRFVFVGSRGECQQPVGEAPERHEILKRNDEDYGDSEHFFVEKCPKEVQRKFAGSPHAPGK
jgi:hypothetical protein